jgi:Zn-dependent protease
MLATLRENIITALYMLPAILLALSVHEFAHAYVSTKLGDPLPRATGRLTLNPVKHIDPIGFVMLLLVRFGWAKPVLVDPRFYKNKKLGMSLVALAGPLSNLILGFISTIIWLTSLYIAHKAGYPPVLTVIATMCQFGVTINIGLAIFNLLPVSPLDGSKLLAALLPMPAYEKVIKYERYGFIVLLILLFDLPRRFLSAVGVPYSISMWFSLRLYLQYAYYFILDIFLGVLNPIFSLL